MRVTTTKETEVADKPYFEQVAAEWDVLRQSFFSDTLRERACAAAGVAPGQRVADLGAGTGFLTEELLARGAQVIAVEPSQAMLAELQARYGGREGVELREGALEALPLADREVQVAFANMVLHHVEDPAAAIREMARVVAPGGRVVITDLDQHSHEFLRTEHHDRWMGFRRPDLRRWLEDAGLVEVVVEDAHERCCASSACGSEHASIGVFLAGGSRPIAGEEQGEDREQARLFEEVRRRYSEAARQAASGARSTCCGPETVPADPITRDLYTFEEVGELPQNALKASLGCGNPTALAELHAGEVVLDLGSGGGIDVLLSARRVGPTGKAYGLDMTEEMLELARSNQAEAGVENAEFLKGRMEAIPLPDESVDVIVSNCVINLSTDKDRVLREARRVLRPGGRLAIADIVVEGEMPPALRQLAELWSGCIAGALEISDYRRRLASAGFEEVEIEITRTLGPELLDAAQRRQIEELGVVPEKLPGSLASAFVRARKPAAVA